MLVLGANDFVDWRDAQPDNIDEKSSRLRLSAVLSELLTHTNSALRFAREVDGNLM